MFDDLPTLIHSIALVSLTPSTGLQQMHSRLLAIVDSDHSLMPHLLVEIVSARGVENCAHSGLCKVHTEESISVVYADFVPRTPNEILVSTE